MSLFYRVILITLQTAHRASGNGRLRLPIRRAALRIERRLDVKPEIF